jgi:hypothetical protein
MGWNWLKDVKVYEWNNNEWVRNKNKRKKDKGIKFDGDYFKYIYHNFEA